MPTVDAYAERKTREAMREAWGHLAPEPQRSYPGTVVSAHGAYGDACLLEAAFEGLPDSPWLFEHLQEFVGDQVCRRMKGASGFRLWRFEGRYVAFKNGGHRFSGEVRPLRAAERFARRRKAPAKRVRKP